MLNSILDSVDSTNAELQKLARAGRAQAPHGSWLSARVQTAGRGRQGRAWVSEPGNLYLSIVVRDVPSSAWTWIPLAAAVGVREALDAAAIQIKWPNDLGVFAPTWKKLGGILVEAFPQDPEPFAILGIGVNIAHAPTDLPDGAQAVALREIAGTADVDVLRPRVLASVLETLGVLRDHGGAAIERVVRENLIPRADQEISWTENGEVRSAKATGLGTYGELRVVLNGAQKSLYSEEIRLKI